MLSMSPTRSWAVARNDFRILRRDPVFVITMLVAPLIVMAFIKPVFATTPARFGVVPEGATSNGASHAVPGMTVLFSFFLVGNLGFGVFREHGWNTWERLRASRVSAGEVMAGKVVVPLFTLALQLTVLLGLGGMLFGLKVRGSMFGLVAVAAAFAICLVSVGLLLMAAARSILQVQAVSNLSTMLFAGLGGAIAPIAVLPLWARTIAPVTPTYWAMRGFRSTIGGGGVSTVLLPVAVLLGFSVVVAAIAVWRFRYDEVKVTFA
jgi:ABC-2 type transport system permease protein